MKQNIFLCIEYSKELLRGEEIESFKIRGQRNRRNGNTGVVEKNRV